MEDKILSKIAAALRLAEKAATEAEAEAAMQVAQRLSTTYSIDLAVARAHQAKSERRPTPTHKQITLGPRGKKGLHTYVSLFTLIGGANDVTCNIAHNSTYVIAFGYEEDVELTEALYASLVVQMVAASDAYLKAGTYKDEMVSRMVTRDDGWGKYRTWGYAPVSGHTARIDFQRAFAYRVGTRLKEARAQARDAAVAADRARMVGADGGDGRSDATTGTELALIAKSVEIRDYYKQHSTARGTYKGGRRGSQSMDAWSAGQKAGSSARLGGEKAIGGGRKELAS